MSKRLNRFGALLVCAGCAASVYGQTTRPRVYSMGQPVGVMQNDLDFVKVISVDTSGKTAQQSADAICDHILNVYNPGPERLAIWLQNYGMGRENVQSWYLVSPYMTYHPLDALAPKFVNGQPVSLVCNPTGSPNECLDPANYPPNDVIRDYTPWMTNGVAESGAYMQAFIDRFRARRDHNSAIPTPWRFHFDTENDITSCCNGIFVRTFDALRCNPTVGGVVDPWNTEPVYTPTGTKTMAQLFTEWGGTYLATGCVNSSYNVAWADWYGKVAREAVEGAMGAAAYSKIIAQRDSVTSPWTGVRVSNYVRSTDSDDVLEAPYPRRDVLDPGRGGATGSGIAWQSPADMQAPFLYPVHPANDPACGGDINCTTGNWIEAAVRVGRQTLDAGIHSFEGGNSDDIAPWFPVFSTVLSNDTWLGSAANEPITREFLYRLIALARSRDVQEFILWSNPTLFNDFNLNATEKIFDHVWGSTLSAVSFDIGTSSTTEQVKRLQYALRDHVVITPASGVARLTTDFATNFRDVYTTGISPKIRNLRAIVESKPGTPGNVSVEFYDWNGATWVSAGAALPSSSYPFFTITTQTPGSNPPIYTAQPFISSTGSVRVRVTFTSATGDVDLDMVQLIAVGSRCLGDANDDGVVNFADTTAVLQTFGVTGGPDLVGDANDDGAVNFDDQTAVLGQYGVVCR